MSKLLDAITWTEDGLLPAIAQDYQTGDVLMMAWMNKESLQQTIETGRAVYFSRSRGKLWAKGETSGHTQNIHSMHLDCDGDTLLLKVDQKGGIACHTGRKSCFYQKLDDGKWTPDSPVLKSPDEMYNHE